MGPVYEIHGSGAGVTTKMLEFLTGLHSTRPAGIRWDSSFSKPEECLHSGPSGAHWQSFKIDLKREWKIPGLPMTSCGMKHHG